MPKIYAVRRSQKLPNRDKRGRIRIKKGIAPNGKPAKIQIANIETSDAEAKRRMDLIHLLYEKQLKSDQRPTDFEPCWSTWYLDVAKEIGAGRTITDKFLGMWFGKSPAALSAAAIELKSWGIPVFNENEAVNKGFKINKEQIESMVAEMVQEKISELKSIRGPIVDQIKLPEPMEMSETATLENAIDSYIQYLEKTGERGSNGKLKTKVSNNIRELERIKRNAPEHVDLPLWKIDITRWEELVSIWKNRPLKEDGERTAKGGAKQIIKRLYRFAKWLHTTPEFTWKKPDGFEDVDRSIISLPEDDNGEAFQTITKETYTPEELAILMDFCDDMQKAMIATCVNCAFGQSEIGQWKARRVILNQVHPHAAKINFDSTENDSFIVGPRPKTTLYGEHLLWSEVADALKPIVEDGREYIWLNGAGKPIYKQYSKQPGSEINNWWNERLMPNVLKKHPDFPKLPFGSLRDVLPNLLTRDYGQDVASLALQHQTFVEDDLLKCYANLPFARFFEATADLKKSFQPMLDKLK